MAITGTFQADFSSFQAAVAQAEVSLKGFEQGAGKVETSLNKMTNSLSGTKVIQEATVMAEAVDRIGGVSKLTDAEMRRLGATVSEAAAKMKAMGVEVPPGIQRIVDATQKVEPAMSLAGKASSLLTSAFGQFTAANLAATAISKLVSGVGAFIEIGVKLPAVQSSFTRLTAGMQQDGAQMLANMTTATKGMVANYDLMLSANKAMLLGLPVTSTSMGELAKTATILGRAMGQDATTSLNDLITALGRSSPMILDNLGLTVKVGEANEVYAAKLHKTVEQLTDAEKKMAFYEAAMVKAREKTAELGDTTQTLGEIASTVWTQMGNAVSQGAGKANVALGLVLSSWKEFGQFIVDSKGSFLLIGEALEKAAERVDKLNARTKDINLTVQAVVDPLAVYRQHLAELETGVTALTSEQVALVLQGSKLGDSVSQISTALGVNERAVQATITAHEKLTTVLKAEADAWAKTLREISNTAGMEQMADAIAKDAREVENLTGMWRMETDAFQLGQAAKAAGLAQDRADAAAHEALMDSMVTVIGKLPPAFAAAGAAAVASAQATEMSWGQAMASVSAGLGVMTGTIQNATGKGGVTRYDDYNNPYTHIPGVNAPGRMSPGGLAGFADGGPVMRDGPIYAHAGEFVLPKGGGVGTTVIVNVDARESFYDTPSSVQRLGDKVGAAVLAQLRNRGSVAG